MRSHPSMVVKVQASVAMLEGSGNADVLDYNRFYGYSVRLVRQVK